MKVVNVAQVDDGVFAEIVAEIQTQENLADMMRWALADKSESFSPTIVADVVVQDEYTHDVIVPWRDGLVLVYDTT